MPWRPMTAPDLPQVKALADLIHVSHPEDMDVFDERLRLYPQGCLVLAAEDRLFGYALTHPWHFGEPPPLNSHLGELPRNPSTYYVHDVALHPEARGRGHASQAADLLAEQALAAGFDNLSLVAVNRSQAFWERLRFRATNLPGLNKKLLSYGADAVLMVRKLAEGERLTP